MPLKSSPSHQTLPASSASCSVRDIEGIAVRAKSSSRPVTWRCLKPASLNLTRAAKPSQSSISQSQPLPPNMV